MMHLFMWPNACPQCSSSWLFFFLVKNESSEIGHALWVRFFFGGGGGQMFSSRVEASAFQRLLSWDSNPCIPNQTESYRNWFLLFEWHSLDDRWTEKSNFHDIYKDVIETHEVSENETLLLAKREPFNVIAVPI